MGSQAVVAQQDVAEDLYMAKHDAMNTMLQKFDGLRGTWIGFNRGLYKQSAKGSEMEKKCMDSVTRNQLIEAYGIWLGTDDVDQDFDLMSAFGDMMLVFANMNECGFRKPIKDIMKFCKSSNEPNHLSEDDHEYDDLNDDVEYCTFGGVLDNLTKNAFTLMAKGSSMGEIMKEYPSENPDALMAQSLELGEDFGTFARVGLDFVPQ